MPRNIIDNIPIQLVDVVDDEEGEKDKREEIEARDERRDETGSQLSVCVRMMMDGGLIPGLFILVTHRGKERRKRSGL